ncbi:MAG: hypothetical protein IID51_11945 [Proteobacteria bacterium]|nr:hypothetical protein [Pseudomonadota bacterium]
MPTLVLTADTVISTSIETTLNYEHAVGTGTDGISITVTLTGVISTLGLGSDGIHAIANGLNITNDGLITTASFEADGIHASGIGNSITNNGTISLIAGAGSAIVSIGDNSVTINTGTLESQLGNSLLVDIWGQNASFDNSGIMTGSGYKDLLVSLGGRGASFNNSGSITATGGKASAVFFEGETFTNSGSISSNELTVDAYNYDTAQFIFENSGTIAGGTDAILINHWHDGGPGVTSLTNSGTLSSNGYTVDLWSEHGGTVTLTNTATGLIEAAGSSSPQGNGAVAVFIWSDTEAITLANQGNITASGIFDPDIPAAYHWIAAIEVYSLTSINFTNSGTISAELTAVTPDTIDGVQTVLLDVAVINLQNSGTISNLSGGNAISLFATGASTLDNSGLIEGAVYFTSASAALTLTNTGTIDGDVVLGGGDDVIDSTLGTITGTIETRGGNDTISTGSGDDTILAGSGDDTLEGGAGADTLDGGSGSDTASYANSTAAVRVDLALGTALNGDAEGDTLISIENLSGSIHGDVLIGNGGDNILSGNAGEDLLWARGGDDTLYGGDGDDRLAGLAGDDVLNGDAGNDFLEGGTGADSLDGGSGVDTASYAGSAGGVRVDLYYGTGLGGDAEGDTLTSIENLTGSDFRDTLLGNGGANILTGGGGNDVLWARGGNDTLIGGAGNDLLAGHGGNDFLDGGAGADNLIGGAGADTLDGGAGSDTASYAGSAAGVRVDLALGTASGGDAEGDTLTGIENLSGSDFGDVLLGNGGANILTGGAGNDVLWARGGNDTLFGGDGNDLLAGLAGDDTLIGGAGADRLIGGAGADTFVFSGTWGDDTVTDFEDGVDLLDFSGSGLGFADLTISQSASDTLIEDAFGNSIILEGITATDITADDFLF